MQTTRHTHETGGKEVYAGMTANFSSFRKKELINVSDGMKLGFVDDIMFDSESAEVRSLVVYGRPKLFGLLGRGSDITIPWSDIQMIGEDTILVKSEGIPVPRAKKKAGFFEQLFS